MTSFMSFVDMVMLAALLATFIDIALLVPWWVRRIGSWDWSRGCWCRIKMSLLAEPTLALLMYSEFPRILISFLSIPLSMRVLLSLRSVDSVFLSAIDMKGFKNTLGKSAFDILCLFERTEATSQERTAQ